MRRRSLELCEERIVKAETCFSLRNSNPGEDLVRKKINDLKPILKRILLKTRSKAQKDKQRKRSPPALIRTQEPGTGEVNGATFLVAA